MLLRSTLTLLDLLTTYPPPTAHPHECRWSPATTSNLPAGALQLPRRTWSRCLDSGSAVRKNLRPVAVSNDCSTKESASSSSIFDERSTW